MTPATRAIVALALLATACQGAEGPSAPTGEATTLQAEGIEVEVPAGAGLPEGGIQISPVDVPDVPVDNARAVKAWELGPAGSSFVEPLRLKMTMSFDELGWDASPEGIPQIFAGVVEGDSFSRLEALALQIDETTGEVVLDADISHFSTVVVIEAQEPSASAVRIELRHRVAGRIYYVGKDFPDAEVEVAVSGPDFDLILVDSVEVKAQDESLLGPEKAPEPNQGQLQGNETGVFGVASWQCRKPGATSIAATVHLRFTSGDLLYETFSRALALPVTCRPLKLRFSNSFDQTRHANDYELQVLRGQGDITEGSTIEVDWAFEHAPNRCGQFAGGGRRQRSFVHATCDRVTQEDPARVEVEVRDISVEGVICTYRYEQGARENEGRTVIAPDRFECEEV